MSITSKNIFPWQTWINKAKRFEALHKGMLDFLVVDLVASRKIPGGLWHLATAPLPCQLVKVAFMACHCFLYDSDYVWERSADQTMWGQRKPKGGNLKTTPPSEIFTTTAQGVQERKNERRGGNRRKEEESEGKANESCKRSKDMVKAGEEQWCLYLLTILCPFSWIIEEMDWGLLNIHT